MAKDSRSSRYFNAQVFLPPEAGRPSFSGIRPRPIGRAEGVLEHMVEENERLDLLSLYYYDDTRLWWRIIDANPEIIFAADLSLDEWVGKIILIPRAR